MAAYSDKPADALPVGSDGAFLGHDSRHTTAASLQASDGTALLNHGPQPARKGRHGRRQFRAVTDDAALAGRAAGGPRGNGLARERSGAPRGQGNAHGVGNMHARLGPQVGGQPGLPALQSQVCELAAEGIHSQRRPAAWWPAARPSTEPAVSPAPPAYLM